MLTEPMLCKVSDCAYLLPRRRRYLSTITQKTEGADAPSVFADFRLGKSLHVALFGALSDNHFFNLVAGFDDEESGCNSRYGIL